MVDEIKRGCVYWASFDEDVTGSEMRGGRPVVVLSGDNRNIQSDTIVIAFMSSAGEGGATRVRVYVQGQTQFVCTDQIRTIDKSRFVKYVWTLSRNEMERVSGGLAVAMCLPLARSEAPRSEAAATDSSEVLKLRAELEAAQGMYKYVLNELINMRIGADMAKATLKAEEVEEVKEEPPKAEEKPYEETTEKIEINTCTEADLRNIGCSALVAHSIVSNRPYESVDKLRWVPYLTSVGFKVLKDKVCCIPVVKEKVASKTPVETPSEEPHEIKKTSEEPTKINVNTASAAELMAFLGIGKNTASGIAGYRKKNGKYKRLEDILKAKYVTSRMLVKHRDRMTV